MTLYLDQVLTGWECPPGELRARLVTGRDDAELLQLRVDLGLMQMFPDGRPDGQRYRGFPNAYEYIEHERRLGGHALEAEDWDELERELLQTNYRRMAFATVAEDALRANEQTAARRLLRRAVADVETCLEDLRLLRAQPDKADGNTALLPTLLFDRARLAAQLRISEGAFEEAIERAEQGVAELDAMLGELGYDEAQRAEDPGLVYLRKLSAQLRQEYGIARTLSEQLREAIDNEDFETAAELREELRRRQNRRPARDSAGE